MASTAIYSPLPEYKKTFKMRKNDQYFSYSVSLITEFLCVEQLDGIASFTLKLRMGLTYIYFYIKKR